MILIIFTIIALVFVGIVNGIAGDDEYDGVLFVGIAFILGILFLFSINTVLNKNLIKEKYGKGIKITKSTDEYIVLIGTETKNVIIEKLVKERQRLDKS